VIAADEQREVTNILEGLAIASGVRPPRVAVIDDPAPNSFGVGTRPSNTVIGVTTGLGERLSRDELEAVLADEVSRIRSWDVALVSWAVALTSGAISAVDDPEGDNLLRAVSGSSPADWRNRCRFGRYETRASSATVSPCSSPRNPTSLIHALEKLDADASAIRHVSRATGPLWLEFPAHVLGPSPSRATRRLARELLLDERIDNLRELAGNGTRPVTQ
jgi:hypothetical protein